MKAFEIGLCRYCNHMYIIGKIYENQNGCKLHQNADIDIDENYGDIENINVDYFLIKDNSEIDEKFVDDVEEYVVCSKCGTIFGKNNINAKRCNCGKEYEVELLRVKNEESEIKNNISTCLCCTRRSSSGVGIVSGFHLSKDSATALLSQILYETLSKKDNESEDSGEKKLSLNFNFENKPKTEKEINMKKVICSEKAPGAIGPYSQAIEANGMIFVSGQLPIDAATGKMAEGIEEQARQSLENIKHILEEAGLTMGNIVKTTVFLQDMSFFAGMNGVYATYFDGAFPARSAVAVKALPKDALVEIECIAVR